MWEKVSGGSVNLACGSISGEALCLNGESERYVVLAAANTAAGGAVHFGLRMGWDGGAPCDVLLEYKRQGGEWEAMQRFSFMRQAEGNNTELERAADETADSDAATTSVATGSPLFTHPRVPCATPQPLRPPAAAHPSEMEQRDCRARVEVALGLPAPALEGLAGASA
ncbi:hypothetical protein CYMTET_28255 [Cymbomonas tetramitiformis]|uniref:Uncharacterized protein n=1 Tax=Cymbomonas tetramitiformis TaxID=36881 RepID=A0AAE0KWC8_9CHLO|nr:hypothetical protein CYMTET_28255 [Cymbomonas tetramitiformis]